ncbi:hypothetical protein [Pseudoclavibacter sp. RFBB5]|uniref:hypothetical protein n=1 Tax=Pseudoclavibacter sp. RFBB5 TaxID=2080574 RepID=UPI000CE9126D|nr:hypothetical protein [Pseudoclavibacter sp. RFBB5]PPG29668.1 hypothetical protein C5B97_11910 [Pseudoclavibacter sp. RFBB5]
MSARTRRIANLVNANKQLRGQRDTARRYAVRLEQECAEQDAYIQELEGRLVLVDLEKRYAATPPSEVI